MSKAVLVVAFDPPEDQELSEVWHKVQEALQPIFAEMEPNPTVYLADDEPAQAVLSVFNDTDGDNFRDAKTGRYVGEDYAKDNPDTTVHES